MLELELGICCLCGVRSMRCSWGRPRLGHSRHRPPGTPRYSCRPSSPCSPCSCCSCSSHALLQYNLLLLEHSLLLPLHGLASHRVVRMHGCNGAPFPHGLLHGSAMWWLRWGRRVRGSLQRLLLHYRVLGLAFVWLQLGCGPGCLLLRDWLALAGSLHL